MMFFKPQKNQKVLEYVSLSKTNKQINDKSICLHFVNF